MMMKRLKVFLLTGALLLSAGCQNLGGTGKGEIVFADPQWDSIKFHNAVAGTIAQEVFGYDSWKEISGSTPITHEGIKKGEIDVHMEEWTDNIAVYQEDLDKGKFQELSVNFDDNYQGLYVPRYVIEGDSTRGIEAMAPNLKYVWDLLDYPEVFPDAENKSMGRIYGAIPGWEADKILHNKYLHYELDEKFVYFRPGSDAALSAAIKSAYDKGEAIVAYYWEPTWLLGMLDMVLLEDKPFERDSYLDGKTELPPVRVTVAVSNKFAEDENNKDFMDFLGRYKTSSSLTSEALAYMEEHEENDYKVVARWFLKEHPKLIEEWLEPEDAAKLKSFLED